MRVSRSPVPRVVRKPEGPPPPPMPRAPPSVRCTNTKRDQGDANEDVDDQQHGG